MFTYFSGWEFPYKFQNKISMSTKDIVGILINYIKSTDQIEKK